MSEIMFMDIVLNKGFKLITENSKINLEYIQEPSFSVNDGGRSFRKKISKKNKKKSFSYKKQRRNKSLKKSLRKLKKKKLMRSAKIFRKK